MKKSIISSLLSSEGIISKRRIYLGGLKKCVPQNFDLKLSDLPSHNSEIGILDVFEVTKA
jgi:hypothetical protein